MTDDDGKGWGPPWARKRKGWGGPPWMKGRGGGPFGPDGFGGGRPGRMFGQGELQLLLLALIAEKPSHGYDLIRTIEVKFGGDYSPSPGTIYPTLTLLEEQELIEGCAEAGSKKSYAATEKGRQHLAQNREQVTAMMARIDIMAGTTEARMPPHGIMHAVMTLRHAILAKPGGWSEAEEARVRKILETAAKEIVGSSA
jgi:DNA-binding PadR family transcriptional regulator